MTISHYQNLSKLKSEKEDKYKLLKESDLKKQKSLLDSQYSKLHADII
jgi:hypothetical protein